MMSGEGEGPGRARSRPGAVLFDLDDTLYPRRRFVVSGFAAVSRHLAATAALDGDAVFKTLCAAWRGPARGRELQILVDRFGVPHGEIDRLIDIMRRHAPSLRLPSASREVLATLADRWRLAIVTNGIPSVQESKIAALGLGSLVDTVVFATEHGSGRGKPDQEPFIEALTRLQIDAARAVFVGDDEECDVGGAAAAGMRTILLRRSPASGPACRADAVVETLGDVPRTVASLLERS